MPEEPRIDVIPVVASLKDRLETIRCSEMKRIRGQIGRLSPEQEVAIDSLTHGLVNNIINAPVSTLERVACDADASALIDIVMRLFDLHPSVTKTTKFLPARFKETAGSTHGRR